MHSGDQYFRLSCKEAGIRINWRPLDRNKSIGMCGLRCCPNETMWHGDRHISKCFISLYSLIINRCHRQPKNDFNSCFISFTLKSRIERFDLTQIEWNDIGNLDKWLPFRCSTTQFSVGVPVISPLYSLHKRDIKLNYCWWKMRSYSMRLINAVPQSFAMAFMLCAPSAPRITHINFRNSVGGVANDEIKTNNTVLHISIHSMFHTLFPFIKFINYARRNERHWVCDSSFHYGRAVYTETFATRYSKYVIFQIVKWK